MSHARRLAEDMKQALKVTDHGADGIDLVVDATGAEVSFLAVTERAAA